MNEKKPRGFAALSPEKRRAVARLGGVKAHEKGTAHKWNKAEAKAAGEKGGAATAEKRAG